MSDLAQLAVVVGIVFAVNLLPAFGPPTWAVLVFFSLDSASTSDGYGPRRVSG